MENTQFTTQESSFSEYSMPGYSKKRSRTSSGSYSAKKRKLAIPRTLGKSIGVPSSNVAIIPLTDSVSFDLTADVNKFFTFDTANVYINGVAQTMNGASDVAAVFDLMRIHKVEFTVFPTANELGYNTQTLATGQTNIPVVYEAFDPVGQAARTVTAIQQLSTCRTGLFDKPYKRTIYPRLEGSNGIVDVGVNQRNLFEHSGSGSSQVWRGWQLYIDMANVVWTYSQVRVVMKIYMECMMSK